MPVLSIILFGVLIVALIDIITRDEWQVKHLPKFVWILLVVLLPLLGTVLWFTLGREYDQTSRPTPARQRRTSQQPSPAPAGPRYDTRTTEQQLADLEREIEEARLRDEVERRKAADE